MLDHSLFFAVSQEPLACVDLEHRLVAVNARWAALFGDVQAEAKTLADLLHPDDREAVLAGLGASGHSDVVARLRGLDGESRTFGLRGARSPTGELYVSAQERGREEALGAELAFVKRRLDALFSAMQDEVYMTDERGIIDGLARPPAGVPREAVLGSVMLDWSAPEERALMEARYHDVRKNGALVVYETIARFPDGSKQYVASRLGPIMDGDRCVGTVLITRNVTQERLAEEAKRRAEQQVREYMVQLERSNRELERFASVASHDLQEPLRKIQAFCDRLRERFGESLTDIGRDYLARVIDAAKRMQDLINDLLMFSRLSTKEKTHSRVNLNKIAKTVLSDLEVRLEETHGKVHVGELPTLEADAVHMRQLLQNLIGNALKFSRPDVPPVVHVTAETVGREDDGSGMIRLKVADNGIGIEPRYHERIFGIFERLHGRGKYEGTGVGLAVCRKIAEQHHGSIEVSSVVGEGTTFTILLPMKQPEKGQQT